MIRLIAIIGVTYLAVVFQTTVCPSLRVAGATADVLVFEALAVVVLSSSPYSFLWAGWIGLLHDLVSTGPIGPCMFWLTVTGYLVARLRQQLFTEHVLAQSLIVLLGTAVTLAGSSATRLLLGEASGALPEIGAAVCGSAVYTALAACPVLAVVGRFSRSETAWAT